MLGLRVAARAVPDAGEKLTGFLEEEAEGLFGCIAVPEAFRSEWSEALEPDARSREDVQSVSILSETERKSATESGERLFKAAVGAFDRVDAARLSTALRDESLTSKVVSLTPVPGAHAAIADPVLPESQRRSVLRCFYLLMVSLKCVPLVSLDAFFEEAGSGSKSEKGSDYFAEVTGTLGAPDTPAFFHWNDMLDGVHVRSQNLVMGTNGGAEVLDAGERVVAILRRGENAGAVLVLANLSSEAEEAVVHRKLLPQLSASVMTDLLTGDTVYVSSGADHRFNVELEPHEIMWLELPG